MENDVGQEGRGMISSGNVMAVVLKVTIQLQVSSQGWHKTEASQGEIINGALHLINERVFP